MSNGELILAEVYLQKRTEGKVVPMIADCIVAYLYRVNKFCKHLDRQF